MCYPQKAMQNNTRHIAPIELITKYLARESGAGERELVENWIKASDENKKEFEAIENLWLASNTAIEQPEINVEAEWRRMENTLGFAKKKQLNFQTILRVAAAIFVISSLAAIGLRQSMLVKEKSGASQLSSLVLPDGSTISLNANSKISYSKNFGKTTRELTLEGEAFFEVAHDKTKPFIVIAHNSRIEVLGTQFNVKAYKNQTEVKVSVTEGTVKFSDRKKQAKSAILKAGESATYNKTNQKIILKPAVNVNDMAWKSRKMYFEHTPLHEVASVLENTYQVEIEVSETVRECSITVSFEDSDLASVLSVLKSTLSLRVRVDNDKIFLSGQGCQNP